MGRSNNCMRGSEVRRFCFFFFFILIFPVIALGISTLTNTSALSPSSAYNLSSPNGKFSMGFFSLEPDSYYVGIWYSNLSVDNEGIVWIANRSQSVPLESSLQITADGQFELLNTNSKSVIWVATNLTSNDNVVGASQAELLDSGNLVLKDDSSNVIWQSFEHPTDTLLPDQNFTYSSPADNPSLMPWITTTDPSHSTTYSLVFGSSSGAGFGKIRLLYYNDSRQPYEYWITLTATTLPDNSISTFYLNSTGMINLYNSASGLIWSDGSCTGTDGSYRKVKLSVDGNLRVLNWQSNKWKTEWRALYLQCSVNGTCGDHGVCDADKNNATLISTGGGNCDLAEAPADKICSCQQGFNRVNGSCAKSSGFPVYAIILIAAASFLIVAFFAALLIIRYCQHRSGFRTSKAGDGLPGLTNNLGGLRRFSFEDLYRVTQGFDQKNKLGSGGFGSVYRGTLKAPTTSPHHGKLDVAIKRLDKRHGSEMAHDDDDEQGSDFMAEIETLASIRHVNVVSLIGFCAQGAERLLVYEFVANGSLDSHLFSESDPLSWDTRFEIAVGAATGIEYLHSHCPKKIVHMDIKPANILIDEGFKAKVADFGISQIMSPERTHLTNHNPRGTPAYMAPECWQMGAPVTEKADAYSFGAVLLEIVSGRRITRQPYPDSQDGRPEPEGVRRKARVLYFQQALELMKAGNFEGLIDERLQGVHKKEEDAERLVKVAFWCLQANPDLRPSMEDLLLMIKGHKPVSRPPPPPPPLPLPPLQVTDSSSLSASQQLPVAEQVSEGR